MDRIIVFGIYIAILFFLFGLMTVFVVHIREFMRMSPYIAPTLKIYALLVVLFACFGGYQILTYEDPIRPVRSETIELEF